MVQEPGGTRSAAAVLGTDHEGPPTEELLRQLLTHVGDATAAGALPIRSGPDQHPDGAGNPVHAAQTSHAAHGAQVSQEVLLDVELGGDRYTLLLVRTHDSHVPDPAEHAAPAEHPVTLSPREQEIARLIMKGLPNKTIAAVLDISLWTVATYVRRLFAKLGVSSRAEMVARVLEAGLVNTRDS